MSDSPDGALPAAPPSRATALEAAVVFAVAIGPMLATEWLERDAAAVPLTDARLLLLVLFEAVVALALLPWLWRRGWTPRAVAGAPEPMDVARGSWLVMVTMAVLYVPWTIFSLANPELAAGLAAASSTGDVALAPLTIVLVSVVNPIFEEFLWLGYGVHRLAPRIGERAAIALSVLLRTAVHVYEGPWALLGVLPVGLAFSWYCVRSRRLWPVVVAHLIFDAMGLAARPE